jgi:hypothetical protein
MAVNGSYRDRIVGQKLVPLDQLRPNPMNWRTHPEYQAQSLDALLENVGTVQTVVWNEETGNVIDGHLRRELAERRGEKGLKVTVVRLSPEEEKIVLATFDPIGAMAGADESVLRDLVGQLGDGEQWLSELLAATTDAIGVDLEGVTPPDDFTEFGDDIATEHQCPKCGYRWSGGASEAAPSANGSASAGGEISDGADA